MVWIVFTWLEHHPVKVSKPNVIVFFMNISGTAGNILESSQTIVDASLQITIIFVWMWEVRHGSNTAWVTYFSAEPFLHPFLFYLINTHVALDWSLLFISIPTTNSIYEGWEASYGNFLVYKPALIKWTVDEHKKSPTGWGQRPI